MQISHHYPVRDWFEFTAGYRGRQCTKKVVRSPPIMPTYSRNRTENYRTAEKQEQKMFYKKVFMYLFKKLFRLFLEIAPLFKKQNRLIFKTGFLIFYAKLFDR